MDQLVPVWSFRCQPLGCWCFTAGPCWHPTWSQTLLSASPQMTASNPQGSVGSFALSPARTNPMRSEATCLPSVQPSSNFLGVNDHFKSHCPTPRKVATHLAMPSGERSVSLEAAPTTFLGPPGSLRLCCVSRCTQHIPATVTIMITSLLVAYGSCELSA
ncbi:hypothetical protein BV22DRAFT_287417 [Leucogyrophana mollusca]|uniref:Uncharacterized protein n=1 Tax=Leucogyrophana mollusca TaxID=85980 RepID=A0ACB8BNU5_9AGAM|nr:hypothetical protein BV22DRAFT_287417 [Leucogyrophana mollusca]